MVQLETATAPGLALCYRLYSGMKVPGRGHAEGHAGIRGVVDDFFAVYLGCFFLKMVGFGTLKHTPQVRKSFLVGQPHGPVGESHHFRKHKAGFFNTPNFLGNNGAGVLGGWVF